MVNIRFMRAGSFRIGSQEATQTKPFLLRIPRSKPGLTRYWGGAAETRVTVALERFELPP